MAKKVRSLAFYTSSNPGFGWENLPYGIIQPEGQLARVGLRLGNFAVDCYQLALHPLIDLSSVLPDDLVTNTLNPLIAEGKASLLELRRSVQQLLRSESGVLFQDEELHRKVFLPLEEVEELPPVNVGDFTDFYASRHHAERVGSLFRDPEQPLLPNWRSLPIAYHGRASSIQFGDKDVIRPHGHIVSDQTLIFGPTQKLDFELEVGAILCGGNTLGSSIPLEAAADHLLGLVLVNDWSARDIQQWEYQPLGPFLGKSFATSVSPWIVPWEALTSSMVPTENQEPAPLAHLTKKPPFLPDVALEVLIENETGQKSLAKTNTKYLYWSFEQMVVHHASNGCNLRAGDLLATGTVSGPHMEACGCLLELSEGGKQPWAAPEGQRSSYLRDGDMIILKGSSHGISFGTLKNKIVPAI